MTEQDTIDVAVLGASGYTGAELIRLLVHHPRVRLAALGAHAQAGQPLGDVYPHLALYDLPPLKPIQDIAVDGLDLVFCALPHATSQEIIRTLPPTLRVIDLSADFRLDDPAVYAAWYGGPHQAPALQGEVAYGLTEHARAAIRSKRIIACPGCYPTAALLGLIPLLRAGMVDADDIVIDAKSGVTGAGRSVKQQNLFSEVADSLSPYGVGRHRH
ncbi:MAG: N-acetyl-gamma-glutamyl-phosphate reductase, partial [Pseudomonadota bacterium]